MKKKRSSNIELLRILAMFFIVLHHAIVHGVLGEYVGNIYSGTIFTNHWVNITIANILVIVGKTGVEIFVIITGYFMITSRFKGNKLIKLWIPIWIYSVLGLVIGILSGKFNIGIIAIVKSVFPITFVDYWFMTAYIVLYCAIPFLNILWKSINSKMKQYLLLFLFVIDVIIPTLLGGPVAEYFASNEASQFLFLYFVGAFLREKDVLNGAYKLLGKILFCGSWALYALLVVGFMFVTKQTGNSLIATHAQHFAKDGSPLVLGMAVGLFIIFGGHPIKSNAFINRMSTSMFAVYLIHDNQYLRVLIWHDWFHLDRLVQTTVWQMLVGVIGLSVLVFVTATIIDVIREAFFNRIEIKASNEIIILLRKLFSILRRNKLVDNIISFFDLRTNG
ncbi:acyltransferase [Levilactobacillus koreensis]|uniref:acyltransferase n=1 Tax=Levilactobacillus koreensis TaxID=637971 RepID=UPI000B0F0356|nr:acyltransferase [Levilactobacillus koreensis]